MQTNPEVPDTAPGDGRTSAMGRLRHNHLATAGLVIVVAFLALIVLTPLMPLADPDLTSPADRLMKPFSDGHWLGTDQLGRDLLSRLVHGTQVSLLVGIAATAVACLIGSMLGLIAAYYGGIVDNLIMRGIDMVMAFPYLLLALAIVAILGPGLLNALLAISVVNIPFFARAVRGATLSLVHLEYIEAARLSGFSDRKIIFSEILPNVMPVIVITISTTIGWMILETAGLSFLGLGAQPPQADLGSMLGDGRKLIITAPHVAALPGLVILVLVIGINLLGDGLRDVLDPRLKSGAMKRPMAITEREPKEKRIPGETQAVHMPEEDEALLAITGLRTHFLLGDQVYRAIGGLGDEAASGVSLHLGRGEALGIVGESGSGKSVTGMSVLGLVPTPPGKIVGGEVRFEDQDLLSIPLPDLQDVRGNRIAYIFQDPLTTLNPLFTVGEQVAETIRRHQGLNTKDAWSRALDLLGQVKLPDVREKAKSYPHQLSGGQRQRVAIAMALANDPDVIIADEPTTALDVTTQAEILDLLNELRREKGAALIFISHDLGVISQVCDRLAVMYGGLVVEQGPAVEVLRDPQHPYTRRLLECVPVLGQPGRTLRAIPGLPPPVNALPSGCAFAPRCDRVNEACHGGPIEMRRFTDLRAVRCLLVPVQQVEAG